MGDTHQQRILAEFTARAADFATAPAITNAEALDLLVQMSDTGPDATVLDVACGAGLVVCAFAPTVRHATGIDITPAMIERAQALQREKGLSNVSWQCADVLPLPYPHHSFSVVTCRYALHHMEQPGAAIAEMARVCLPGGRVLLCDMVASQDPGKAAAHNRMEKLRDPSHVRALPVAELEEWMRRAGLQPKAPAFYTLDWELEALLQVSSASATDADMIRQLFEQELACDRMALQVRRHQSKIWFSHSIAVVVGVKPV